jgi:hypothetical protein
VSHPPSSACPGCGLVEGPKLHGRLAKRPGFHWLEPPQRIGHITVADVHHAASPAEHERIVKAWARDVWAAWAADHATVRDWIDRSLADR